MVTKTQNYLKKLYSLNEVLKEFLSELFRIVLLIIFSITKNDRKSVSQCLPRFKYSKIHLRISSLQSLTRELDLYLSILYLKGTTRNVCILKIVDRRFELRLHTKYRTHTSRFHLYQVCSKILTVYSTTKMFLLLLTELCSMWEIDNAN